MWAKYYPSSCPFHFFLSLLTISFLFPFFTVFLIPSSVSLFLPLLSLPSLARLSGTGDVPREEQWDGSGLEMEGSEGPRTRLSCTMGQSPGLHPRKEQFRGLTGRLGLVSGIQTSAIIAQRSLRLCHSLLTFH